MNYNQALAEVNKRLRFGSKLGLERIRLLLEKLGNPQNKLKFVHVAGTNGKGTTCTYISSILRESGLKTGLFTSPYVVDFRERFQINGEMISEEELACLVEKISPVADEVGGEITEFEFITALGLYWFSEKQCDIVVLEVGLGGRFDATNVIDTPEAAVITSISLDHTGILGDTIEKIAFEKAGIVKYNGNVVMYPTQKTEAVKVFEDICNQRAARLIVPNIESLKVLQSNLFGSDFEFNGKVYHIPFSGIHQVYNAVNAICTIGVLNKGNFSISDAAVDLGLKKSTIPARMEVLSQKPLVIVDGGHNPGCAEALKDVIETNLKDKKITAIMGMMEDKDSHAYLKDVAPYFDRIITVKPENPRSMPAEKLAEIAREFCKNSIAADNASAVRMALDNFGDKTALIVCGSFYMASEIRKILLENLKY